MKTLAATRTDGLGGRLLAMVNAKCLADEMGCRFGFTWNRRSIDMQFHSVDPVDKVFAGDFIEKHWLGEKIDTARFAVLDATRFTRSSLVADGRRNGYEGWICNNFRILKSYRQGLFKAMLPAHRSARSRHRTFGTFGFSEPVRATIAAAGKPRFSRPMAALHLRSGDIVHGHYRSELEFCDKVIPAPLAKAIVMKLASRGLATLMIGQDRATLDYLKSETGAFVTDDFGASQFEDETFKAFFEMALMARCRQIHAGSSVFATIASVMGGIRVIRPKAVFGERGTATAILDELKARQSDYHPLEAAFGYQAAFVLTENSIAPARAREILEKAAALDPQNPAYALKLAAGYFRERNYREGEAVLKAFMLKEIDVLVEDSMRILQVLTHPSSRRQMMAGDFELYFAAGKAGHPYAAACSAHILRTAPGRIEDALAMATLSLEAEPTNRLFRDVELAVRTAAAANDSSLLRG
ncbi:hypothetical protein [Mesorhizobium erdmanii]|uniref:Tetratricopeptide repeat protein n=1 Tax=Mesorhizobium erdmanii TaxID=1777866 RepID=A0A6M7UF45_9HYPH|nr:MULTISPECIES: hypothetical protein [Mesorhizobium]OBQ59373.1 hypothetical protein A8146_21035 [Mesorhizobium loti]QKC75845.1 hypothetical protein EB233_10065 [Mesorhizobium erdmanii]